MVQTCDLDGIAALARIKHCECVNYSLLSRASLSVQPKGDADTIRAAADEIKTERSLLSV